MPEKSAIFRLTMKNITYIMINVRKSAHFCDAQKRVKNNTGGESNANIQPVSKKGTSDI